MPRKSDSQQTTNALQAQAISALDKKIDDLSAAVKEGFSGMHTRQDTTNGKVLKAGADIVANRTQADKDIQELRAEFKYNRIIWYMLTVTVSLIVGLISFIFYHNH